MYGTLLDLLLLDPNPNPICMILGNNIPSTSTNPKIITPTMSGGSNTSIDLSTTLGKKKKQQQQHHGHAHENDSVIHLTSVIYNASGPRTGTSTAMAKIAASDAGGVLAKSATLAAQKGNDLPR
jgi:hypothetical protein